MSTIQNLLKEITEESVVTSKMLKLVPVAQQDWRPHEKSMPMRNLAAHIAELPGWVSMVLKTDELNFADQTYQAPAWSSNAELLGIFEKSLAEATAALQVAKEEDLLPNWTLKNGEQVLLLKTKGEVIRHSISQIVHHRAQLGVYLRLLDIPIPGSYGPSADDPNF